MVKVMIQLYPVLPAAGEAERRAMRPLGRNRERYQQTLEGWHEIIKAADDLGVWGAATIEHHFHSEGYEVGPNPGILDAYWAAITKNIRIGQLGYVMSVQNPIRVAEETAILDHLTKGRCFVGFARGYQNRWTDTLGQHLGSRATMSDGSEADKINREIFEEQVDMVLEAWTQDSIEHNSARWQVPYPHDTGTEGWFMSDWSRELGADGEIDDDGNVRRVSVVPAPYTDPHPPVMVATASSLASAEYCARKGFIPHYFNRIERSLEMAEVYSRTAREAGLPSAPGQNQALVRWMQVGKTMEEARQHVAEHDADIYKHFMAPLEAKQNAYATDYVPVSKDATRESLVDRILDSGLWMAGTVDDVREQFVAQWRQLPAEYCTLIFHYAQEPKESVIASLEILMREIKPALDEITEAAHASPAAAGS